MSNSNSSLPIICNLCGLNFGQLIDNAALHFSGKSHQKKHYRNEENPEKEKCSVFLPDCKSITLNEVLEVFSKHGSIQNVSVFKREPDLKDKKVFTNIRITFETEESAQALIKVPPKISIGTKSVRVLPSKSRQIPSNFLSEEEIETKLTKISFDEVKETLSQIEDSEEQMEALMRLMELRDEDLRQREEIARRIQIAISSIYPKCKVYLFGSTVNGLGFKGCDIDAYVDVGLIEAKKTEKGQEITSLERDSQTRAAKAIKRQLDLFHHQHVANVVFIAARVSIVKLVHVKSGLSCDLSFKNRMAVMNTEFIRQCIEADSRVRIVMVAIRYWAAIYGLSGGGKGGRTWKITNYALTLAIIFYLQTEKILPSVKSLQSPLSEGDSCIIDGWECGYVTDLDKWCSLGKSGNVSQTPMGLLRGFFNFYANFDYKNCVISPYHGDPISDQTELHDLTSFCIQDPFELDLCVTKGYCEDALTIWKNHCAKTYATIKEKPFLDIFQLQIELPPASIQKKINKKIKKGSIIPDESLHYKFELASGEKCKEKYLYRVKSTLRNVLEAVLYMKVIEMPSSISDPALKCPLFVKDERNHEEIGQKQGKLMAALNIIPDKSEMDWKVIQCEARFPVWDHRKTVKVELSLSEAPWTIENETKVSKALMEKFKFQRFETLPPEVTFDASAHYAENEAVCIHLKCKQGRKNIQNRVFSFLEYFLLRVLETELQQVAELKNESD